MLRPDGQVGTITWAWERGLRAGTVWDQILTEAGALGQLAPQDFVWKGEVICAVATKNTSAHIHAAVAEGQSPNPHPPRP